MKRSALVLILLAIASAAHAYVLNVNSSGYVRRWNLLTPTGISTNVVNQTTHAVRYFLAADGYSTTNTAAELNALRATFAQWQAVPNTHVKFEEAGLLNPPMDVNTSDNTNVVYWTKSSTFVNGGLANISGSSGVAFTSTSASTNGILQADIVFNGVEQQWFTDFFTNSSNTFVEGVALHEIGHFIGLMHSPVGCATMLSRGGPGLNPQTGLSEDDIAGVRCLYPLAAANFGAVKGSITKDGSNVFGAAVFIENSLGNLMGGTVSDTNGIYEFGMLSPGNYQARVAPLDEHSATRFLARGRDIISPTYTNADTAFLPTTNFAVAVIAGSTNTWNVAVVAASPSFRISTIRAPTLNSGSFSFASLPASLSVGQSNYFVGVASTNLPTGDATFTITGDGLTLGSPIFNANLGGSGLNFISASINVASNATPGMRSFIVQQGTNVAYANGFLEIVPASLDYNFDGLDDAFQRIYFPLFTAVQAAPGTDTDGDGMNNSSEFIAGTLPTNAVSLLRMLSPAVTNNGVHVRWQSVAGKRYQISSRTNVASGPWQNLGAIVTALGNPAELLDTTTSNAGGFYRVQVLP